MTSTLATRRPALASLLVMALVFAGQRSLHAQDASSPTAQPARAGQPQTGRPQSPRAYSGPEPFGANLFTGAFAGQREDGQNPDYRVLPGDHIMVNAWGSLSVNNVFVVDTQGNIFLPTVGPVRVAGVRNAELTNVVKAQIAKVYRGTINIYTNLLTASPVAVFVTGGVERPGRYAGIPSDSVLFFLDQAGGIDPLDGSYRSISVLRKGETVLEIDLYDFLVHGKLATTQFEDGDTILVGRRGPTVEVRGARPQAMLVELKPDEQKGAALLAIVRRGARTNEVSIEGMHEGRLAARTLSGAELEATGLSDGDIVTFREEGAPERILVRLEGEFKGPAVLSVVRGARLVDVLNYVPVDPDLANTDGVHLQRHSVAVQQRRAINESLDRLERTAMLGLSSSRSEVEIRVREAELVANFVKQARTIQPLGRVVTMSGGELLNILLEDGDTVVIPTKTNIVQVAGEVQYAQALMHRPNLRVRDYVRMSGGYTERANASAVIIVRPNAEVALGGMDMVVHPGDQIMVPPRVDRKDLQIAMDLTQVIYEIAVGASVLLRAGL